MTNTECFMLCDIEASVIERYSSKHFWERRYHTKRMRALQRFLKDLLPQCETFLDVGCGTGEYLSFSKHYTPQVFGLDLSRSCLQRNKPCKVNGLILGDARALPFKNLAFDCVFCSEVIEHVKEQHTAIHEILRVARKSVLLSTPNQGIFRMFISLVGRRLLARIDATVGHICILKFPDLIKKLKNPRWKIIDAFTLQVFPPFFLDTVPLSKITAPLMDKLERFSDRILPLLGSVSIVYLERKSSIQSKL